MKERNVYSLQFTVYSLVLVVALSCGCAKKPAEKKQLPEKKVEIDAKAPYERGIALYRSQRYKEALSAFKEAIDKNPKFAQARCEYGITMMELGRFEEAIEPLKKAAQLDPDYAKAHYALAAAYVRKRVPNARLARAHYEKAVKLGYKVPDWFLKYLETLEKARH